MKELAEIISRLRQHPEGGALATVVQTEGSSYRRPGARMLILPNGQTVGSISGGCLEQDIIAHAGQIMASGRARLLTYDTSTEEDLVFGVGLGCKGVVRILVETIAPGDKLIREASVFLRFVSELFEARRSGVAATVFELEGDAPGEIGVRLMMDDLGETIGQIPTLQEKILEDAREILAKRRSRAITYPLSNGNVKVFLEIIESATPLVIFGAGFDALPLVRLAKEVGFHVAVADPRPAYANRERFPDADEVFVIEPDGCEKVIQRTTRTAAVIMFHNYALDRAFLKALLPLPLRYLGMMGPRKRVEKMREESARDGFEFGGSQLCNLHNPIGLDIGAEGPEEIALAVLGEIQAVLAGHSGGLLREKKSSIHAPRMNPFKTATRLIETR